MRKFNRELIKLLKKEFLQRKRDFENLNIDPSDSELKAVERQFEILDECRLVECARRGCR